ncbi:MAG: Rpn family recombination-promoting nuclease/putative transposase [Cellulosilyticaceae bacterium]
MGAINPFTDFGFKKIFGEEGSKEILIDFLNAVLQRENDIIEIKFQDKEKYGDQYRDRKVIYDIYCTDNKGSKFIVEMQNAKQTYFKDRTIFYSTFPIREQAKRGDWNFELQPVYCIGLLGFDMEKDGNKYYYEAQLKDQDNKVFYDKLTFIYLELPKFKLGEEELESNVEKWLYFLKHLEDFNELPGILNQPIFQKAFERAKEANLTREEKNAYEESLKSYRDNINVIDTARKEGREEEKRQIAKALLDVLDDEMIAIKTGLSIEEVARLRQ